MNEEKDNISIRVIEERLNNWMETTVEHRKEQTRRQDLMCAKIDDIKNILYTLPCEERRTWIENINDKLKLIMIILSLFAGTALTSAVLANAAQKDVEILKSKLIVTDGKLLKLEESFPHGQKIN